MIDVPRLCKDDCCTGYGMMRDESIPGMAGGVAVMVGATYVGTRWIIIWYATGRGAGKVCWKAATIL